MSLNCEKYQELRTLVNELHNNVTKTKPDLGELRLSLIQLREFFLREIAPLTDLEYREQSYNTEMSKQLHLLELDVIFLQGSKQSTTMETRLKNIEARLNTLYMYCEAIIQKCAQLEQ
ncbi:heterocyst frequency control protein PatD [Anabaena sp. FACHB-1237]|uniref:heterocyst frequency control protein PatD n=1 Tax=Anabaena sp. FACHB-1237 TaxID=2692769 RepID=UPI0016806535|nr:heterocyst frequency control protein PatD [Anabaena sp. FACHB-1237]MBD2137921.1 heterocyst frequency control protein PatD [Anabaena sp. FACHB-1237]